MARDMGPRARKKLKLPAQVSDSTLWRLLATRGAPGRADPSADGGTRPAARGPRPVSLRV